MQHTLGSQQHLSCLCIQLPDLWGDERRVYDNTVKGVVDSAGQGLRLVKVVKDEVWVACPLLVKVKHQTMLPQLAPLQSQSSEVTAVSICLLSLAGHPPAE